MSFFGELGKWSLTIDWATTSAVFAAIFAGIALVFNGLVFRESEKTREVQIFYQVVNDIQDLEDKFYLQYAGKPEEEKKNWLSMFYNKQEHLAFLINNKHIRGDFKDYLTGETGFIKFYDDFFVPLAGSKVLDDPEQYAEIKKLYGSLKKSSTIKKLYWLLKKLIDEKLWPKG